MPRLRPVLRIFVASPMDVAEERSIVQSVVAEIDNSIARHLGWSLELVRWEDMIPEMGRPQQVILDQAGIEDTDTFIGILWNRFGSPTGEANSGTQEEFELAYHCLQSRGRPRIHFYFCQRPANLQTEDELKQKGAVIAFRKKIQQVGLIGEYRSTSEFEVSIRSAILSDLLRHTRSSVQETPEAQSEKSIELRSADRHSELPSSELPSEGRHADMVVVPAGPYQSGLGGAEQNIPYDYHIDLTPVTNAQYLVFLERTGYLHHQHDPESRWQLRRISAEAEQFPNHPVTSVSWYDATTYAAWCGKRLPTSHEWEKAARGTDGRNYPWGNEFSTTRCNSREARIRSTTPVRHYESGRSPYGCYDMAGNVFEWVLEWTEKPRFSAVPNSEKVNRGGSYRRPAEQVTCWYIESDPPDLRMNDVGFRCVYVPFLF